jgi:hypothetical protein
MEGASAEDQSLVVLRACSVPMQTDWYLRAHSDHFLVRYLNTAVVVSPSCLPKGVCQDLEVVLLGSPVLVVAEVESEQLDSRQTWLPAAGSLI